MTGRRRYHPFFALRFMRRTLLLYLVPLVQVLFERDWQALSTALAQDAALFCLLAAVSWGMLHASSWELDAEGVLRLRWDLLVSWAGAGISRSARRAASRRLRQRVTACRLGRRAG